MYVKTTTRRNKSGSEIRSLHLAHSARDSAAGRSVPTILHSFGREDQLDRDAIKRLVASLSKLLEPAAALPPPPTRSWCSWSHAPTAAPSSSTNCGIG
ncbi:hypothetical protein SAMN05216275_1783 [Streptosporangium canum]|uniref:Uncharacterized protein n=1 Tax=Streptosporangium canum TaxID=324952 RepID=A0A1I4FYM4_9ACTN|nr:hypothetical protein SAMN05216275_1783 [Streptosporangium canum]